MSTAAKTAHPEWGLSFTDEKKWLLWTPVCADTSTMAGAEGEARAIELLTLKIDIENPCKRAQEFGRICGRIARDQSDRRRKTDAPSRHQAFCEETAMATFWSLIGELSLFHMPDDAPKYAAVVVCRRFPARLSEHMGIVRYCESETQERRRRMLAAKHRKARKQREERAVRR